jgi:hypothetical protein
MSSALVPFRGSSTPSTLLTTSSYANTSALISSRLFSAQTGQAVATELLYRLLFDILNRLLTTLHRTLGHQVDRFSSFLEQRYAQTQSETLDATKAARGAGTGGNSNENGNGRLKITEEVGKAAVQRGFIGGLDGCGRTPCSSTESGEWRRPRGWVADVLEGIQEGRMVEKDFWVHPFQN